MDTTSSTTRLAETPLPDLVAELAHQTSLINAAKARQVELVAAITHTHTVEAEDGTLLHLPMSDTYARLDAAALVAGSLGVSQQAAQHWVDRADKLTGPLAAVHAAMADGVLDEARAKIICDELDEVDDEVAAVVAEHLMPAVRAGLVEDPSGENGARLKRRVQTALAAVDPDAVKARAEKNRTDRCLRRWTSKAGVEEWLATLPATQSIRAWAAIDALAREFIKDGRSETLDQARADAMIALIEGQSTVSYVVTLGIPIPDHLAGDDPGAGPPNPSDPDPSDPDPSDPDPSDPEAVADPSEPGPADPDPADPALRPEDDATAQAAAPPVPKNEGTGLEDDTEHPEPEPGESAPAGAARGEAEAGYGRPSQGAAATGSHDPVGDADRGSPPASGIPDEPDPSNHRPNLPEDTGGWAYGDADRGSPHASGIPPAPSHFSQRGEGSREGPVAERPAQHAVSARGERSVAEVVAAALAALARHGNTDIEITGAGNPQATDVSAAWVADALAKAARDGKVRRPRSTPRRVPSSTRTTSTPPRPTCPGRRSQGW